jgi:ectoine hydroxylase-related dioxygenase (phytanoyl-CoA dioxygenase family)
MSLWLPLGDCPAEMGGLAIARGSHNEGVRDFTVSNGAGAMEVIDPLEGSWVTVPLEAGDVLIFHSLTVHKGLPNLTGRLRLSLDNRYQRASEPVCERCLQALRRLRDLGRDLCRLAIQRAFVLLAGTVAENRRVRHAVL